MDRWGAVPEAGLVLQDMAVGVLAGVGAAVAAPAEVEEELLKCLEHLVEVVVFQVGMDSRFSIQKHVF